MTDDTPALLARIAAALERLSPPEAPAAAPDAQACRWTGRKLVASPDFKPVALDLLTGVDEQKRRVLDNSRRLALGHGAHDILLWGSRGAGKSALVKSTTAALHAEGLNLRIVETGGDKLSTLPDLFDLLSSEALPTLVFIDDLGFDGLGDAARHLRSVLDGGVAARPPHVRLYVTSNRRHILPRTLEEQSSAINPRDVVDDNLALADRFGLSIGFHTCDQDTYLAMVAAYATRFGLSFEPQDALLWSTQRGARSGRIAWHYAVELAGRAGKVI